MRILIASSHRSLVGGVEKYLQSIIPHLQRRGHSVGLLYENPFQAGGEGVDSDASVPTWCATELGLDSVSRSLKNWEPDVVYSQGLQDIALEHSLLGSYPTVLYAHTYHGTCVSSQKCHAWPRYEPCARQLGPSCLAHYHVQRCGGLNPQTMWKLYQVQSLRKSRLSEYRAVLVASRHMYNEYRQHGVGLDRLQLLPLYPTEGLPLASVPPRDPGNSILFVGRLVEVKGAGHLIRALPAAAQKLGHALNLTIAGDGAQRVKIQELANQLGVSLTWAGWVDAKQRADLMRQADLLVVPSLWPEPFGLVGIEAGCFGLPAVGFAVGGIPDWLIAGQSGELAPGDPPTVEGLAQAMVRALADPVHYQKLRRGAWERAKHFSIECHISGLERILNLEPAVSPGPPSQLIPTNV